MDLLPEITHTENTPIPVLGMTMAQCQGDTGMMHKSKLIPLAQKLTEAMYNLVTVMAMVEAGSPETTWTVQVVAHTENRMMVTVRYVFTSVEAKEDNCGKRRATKVTTQTTAMISAVSSQETLQLSTPAQKKSLVRQPHWPLIIIHL